MRGIQSTFIKSRSGALYVPGSGNSWNPYDKNGNVLLSNNNLTTTRNGGVGSVRARVGMSGSDQKYWEIKVETASTDNYVGVVNAAASLSSVPGDDNNGWTLALDGGDYHHNGTQGIASGTYPLAVNSIVGLAYDAGAQTLIISVGGVAITPNPLFTGITGTVYPVLYIQNNAIQLTARFIAADFTFTPPSGYTGF